MNSTGSILKSIRKDYSLRYIIDFIGKLLGLLLYMLLCHLQGELDLKLPKGVTYFFRLNNEHLWIVLVSFIVLGIVLVTQFTYGISHSDSFWAALLPNFFADVIGILVTTYLLTYLLQRNEGKKQKKEIFEVLGYDYNRVVRDMARNYLLLITRNTDFINDEEKRIAEVRRGLDDARRSDKILDMSKILEVQEEIEHTRLPSWKKIFIFQNPAIQEFYSQRNSIRREVSSINKLYPRPEKGGINLESMSTEDQQRVVYLRNKLRELERENKFFWRTSDCIKYYHCFTLELIDKFVEEYQVILPHEIKLAIFRLRSNLECLHGFNIAVSLEALNQQGEESMQIIMSQIAKELSYLLDYFKEFEGVS